MIPRPRASYSDKREWGLQARADKGWLRAYLGMTADPNLRFYQAFTAPDGIDPAHPAFDPLRAFLLAL